MQRSIQNLLFSCGSNLKGLQVEMLPTYKSSIVNLFEHVFVRENITCDDCIEIPYYSSERFEDICIYCGCKVSKLVEGKCLSSLKDIIHSVQYANSKVNHLY